MPEPDFRTLFEQIVTEYDPNLVWAREACPDQDVGDVDRTGYLPAGANGFTRRCPPDERRDQAPIILILESPHKHEYSNGQSLGPANGPTGIYIRKHLGVALGQLCLPDRRPLILMNAIRHQCSLGCDTKKYRDAIFRRMWEKPCIKNDFIRRLLKYAFNCTGEARDFRIVNACTKGNSSGADLRQLVEDTIRTTFCCGSHLRRTHPSSWYGGITAWN